MDGRFISPRRVMGTLLFDLILWRYELFGDFNQLRDFLFRQSFFAVFDEQLNVQRGGWRVIDHHQTLSLCQLERFDCQKECDNALFCLCFACAVFEESYRLEMNERNESTRYAHDSWQRWYKPRRWLSPSSSIQIYFSYLLCFAASP